MHQEVKFPAVELAPVYVGDLEVNGYKAVRNPETEEVFAIASDKYKLVKHEDVLENAEDALASLDLGKVSRTVALHNHGARMRARYLFSEVKFQVGERKKGDLINPTLEIFNSYDLGWKFTVMLGAYRLVCSNGAVVGETFAKLSKRHLPALDLRESKDKIKEGVEGIQMQAIEWKNWSNTPLVMKAYENTLKNLDLNKKETNLLLEEPETSTMWTLDRWLALMEMGGDYVKEAQDLSLWTFFNILTQFTTHRIESEVRRFDLETRIRKSLYN